MKDTENLSTSLPERHLRMVLRVLIALLAMGVFYTFYFAREVLLPIITALLLSFLFAPIVRYLSRKHIPAPISAMLILVSLVSGLGVAAYQLADPTIAYLEKLPEVARRVAEQTRDVQETVTRVQKAASEAEKIAEVSDDADEVVPLPAIRLEKKPLAGDDARSEGVDDIEPQQVQRVQVQQGTFGEMVLSATWQTIVGALIVFALLYFLLASEGHFLGRLVTALPSLAEKKRAVTTVRNIEIGAGQYLLGYAINNALLGIAVAIALYFLDMPNPVLFGAVAAVFNFVPYAGAVATTVIIALASISAFPEFTDAIWPPLVFLVLTTLEGTLMQPLIVGHRMALNPVAILISLVFWSWLWGLGGALLAIPILATAKAVFEEVPGLRPLATFLER